MRRGIAGAWLGIAVAVSAVVFAGSRSRAQVPAGGTNSAQSGQLSFDVVSVKKVDTSGLPLPSLGAVQIEGGSFTMLNVSMETLLHFAYEFDPDERATGLPGRMTSERFDVQARASGSPTEDEVRAMVRSLLADRFKLAAHYETRQMPIYNLVVAKPGTLGPQLRVYRPDEEPCVASPTPKQTVSAGFPASCGKWQFLPESHVGVIRVGGRNMTLDEINNAFQIFGRLDRRVFNQTELTGNYDFILEWDLVHSNDAASEATDPTFSEALQAQLGLKLEAKTGPVKTLVVDHVEEPTPN
jgi:uncharacterized protein (TIGR03435 family)